MSTNPAKWSDILNSFELLTLIFFTVQELFYFCYWHGVPNFLLSAKFVSTLTSTIFHTSKCIYCFIALTKESYLQNLEFWLFGQMVNEINCSYGLPRSNLHIYSNHFLFFVFFFNCPMLIKGFRYLR